MARVSAHFVRFERWQGIKLPAEVALAGVSLGELLAGFFEDAVGDSAIFFILFDVFLMFTGMSVGDGANMHVFCRLENAAASACASFSESGPIQLLQPSSFTCFTSHVIGHSIRRRRLGEGGSEEHVVKRRPEISAYSYRQKTFSFGSALTV